MNEFISGDRTINAAYGAKFMRLVGLDLVTDGIDKPGAIVVLRIHVSAYQQGTIGAISNGFTIYTDFNRYDVREGTTNAHQLTTSDRDWLLSRLDDPSSKIWPVALPFFKPLPAMRKVLK